MPSKVMQVVFCVRTHMWGDDCGLKSPLTLLLKVCPGMGLCWPQRKGNFKTYFSSTLWSVSQGTKFCSPMINFLFSLVFPWPFLWLCNEEISALCTKIHLYVLLAFIVRGGIDTQFLSYHYLFNYFLFTLKFF